MNPTAGAGSGARAGRGRPRGGAGWARRLAIIGVAVNAIQQIAFQANYPQAYPLWNLVIIALNIVVLYELTARWQGSRSL